MEKKKIWFIGDTVDCAKKYTDVLRKFDVSVQTSRFDSAFNPANSINDCDLAILELPKSGFSDEMIAKVKLSDYNIETVLFICSEEYVDSLRLPLHLNCDFVMDNAGVPEVVARIKHLLYPGSETTRNDIISVGNMKLDIGTYQVQVNNEPLDLTYLEYALLAFLVTHPRHSYTRDELLKRVWGFDYLGGSRTVDVHIRRIRAKIGPENAKRLETVRGVGYLWNS